MHSLEAIAPPEEQPELEEAPRRQLPAPRERHLRLGEMRDDLAHALLVLREAVVELLVARRHAGVRVLVHEVRRAALVHWREPPGEDRLVKALRRHRQVCDDAEPAKRLPQHAPLLPGAEQRGPDRLAVPHDAVGPHPGEQAHPCLRRLELGEGLVRDGVGAARAPLVEEDHAVVLECALDPPALAGHGPPGREPRPALQEEKNREILVVPVPHRNELPAEHLDTTHIGLVVVQRHLKEVLRRHKPARQLIGVACPVLRRRDRRPAHAAAGSGLHHAPPLAGSRRLEPRQSRRQAPEGEARSKPAVELALAAFPAARRDHAHTALARVGERLRTAKHRATPSLQGSLMRENTSPDCGREGTRVPHDED
mmetsp:Transcript_38716/g.95276  ORF Transcript_38716/g.95276 Transcript_38716/m.95276 type:complete len:368 (-) Transcript_38716:82-1185(-)